MMNTLPEFLRKGDKIAFVATARFITKEQLNPVINLVERWGYSIYFHPMLFEQDHQFAGNDEIRAKVLQDLINEDSVRAIICVRGGYGTTRMMDLINFQKLID